MTLSDETLMAYADGEVDDATRKAVETAMRDDAAVAARIAQHRALRAAVQGAFSSVIEEPVPQRLVAAARQAQTAPRDNLVSLAQVRGAKVDVRRPSWRPYALAASVFLGLALGYGLWHGSASMLTADASGGWVARGALSRALSEQLASDRGANNVVSIGLSYRAKSGEYCRTFSLTGSASSGVACREGDTWRLKVLATQPTATGASPEYRTAGSADSPLIRATVEGEIQGEPLDQSGESAAREGDWTVIPGRK